MLYLRDTLKQKALKSSKTNEMLGSTKRKKMKVVMLIPHNLEFKMRKVSYNSVKTMFINICITKLIENRS